MWQFRTAILPRALHKEAKAGRSRNAQEKAIDAFQATSTKNICLHNNVHWLYRNVDNILEWFSTSPEEWQRALVAIKQVVEKADGSLLEQVVFNMQKGTLHTGNLRMVPLVQVTRLGELVDRCEAQLAYARNRYKRQCLDESQSGMKAFFKLTKSPPAPCLAVAQDQGGHPCITPEGLDHIYDCTLDSIISANQDNPLPRLGAWIDRCKDHIYVHRGEAFKVPPLIGEMLRCVMMDSGAMAGGPDNFQPRECKLFSHRCGTIGQGCLEPSKMGPLA